MAHVGERLRQRRLALRIELGSIATETRIGTRYLEALETGDWKQLPGAIFARSFARQYARAVGIPESEIEDEIQATFPIEDNVPPLETLAASKGIQVKPLLEIAALDSPAWRQFRRSLLSLAAVVGVCSAVYVGWQRLILGERGQSAAVNSGPAPGAPPTKLPTAAPEPELAALQTAAQNPVTPPAETTEVQLQVPPGATTGMSVRILASQPTWVSITANGQKVFRGTLGTNEARQLTGVERAKLVIGNAGGIEITTDGRPIGPIGAPGQVRVVVLTPDGPQIYRKTASGSVRDEQNSQTGE